VAEPAREGTAPVRPVVSGLGPRLFEVTDPQVLFNVNYAEDLVAAEALLGGDMRG
jgi:CTP:molybdopterin cytidylyltransferase MocA